MELEQMGYREGRRMDVGIGFPLIFLVLCGQEATGGGEGGRDHHLSVAPLESQIADSSHLAKPSGVCPTKFVRRVKSVYLKRVYLLEAK